MPARWGSGEGPPPGGPTAARKHLQPLVFRFFMASGIWGPINAFPSLGGGGDQGPANTTTPSFTSQGKPWPCCVDPLELTTPLQASLPNPLILGCRRQEKIKSQLPQLISAAL